MISLRISKRDVYGEVAKATAYTGAKKVDDEEAFDRISTVDEDEGQLERFWDESRAEVCQKLIGLVTQEGMSGDEYQLSLHVSSWFDEALLPSMEISLKSFFVQNITAKWYVYTNKEEAGDYADKAQTYLDDLHRKALYKRMPKRPSYN